MGWVEGNLYFFGGVSGYCDLNPTCFLEKPFSISADSFRGVQAW